MLEKIIKENIMLGVEKMNKKKMKDGIKVQGFFRIQLGKCGKVVGDSGWQKNTVVNLGFQDYICKSIGALAGSKIVSHMQLGTGTEPDATDTSLQGETRARKTTSNSVVSSKTLRSTASWSSSDNTANVTLQNIGLFNTSAGGTLACGNTYATSQWQSNQDVSATYELRFS